MRTLLLLRGTPGSGKSTFTKENKLEPYTLEADHFRTMVCNPELNEDGDFCISQKNDGIAWRMLFTCLEERMKRGDFTVIDATHSNPNMFSKYKKLAAKYRYRVYCKEFNVSLEELFDRNAKREEYKRVPEQAIKKIYAMQHATRPQSFVTMISSLDEIMNYVTTDIDTGQYKKVVLIGDVHGCFTALEKAICPLRDDTFYIFCGDLLERGLEDEKCLAFYFSIMDRDNVIFVEGNHDTHIRSWVNGDDMPDGFKKRVAKVIEKHTEDKETLFKNLRRLSDRFRIAFPFTFGENKMFVCHGGLSSIPDHMTLLSARQLVHGVGAYETEIGEAFEKSYAKGRTQGFIQVHGHRKVNSTEHSICLEGGVEVGGDLMTLVLTADGRREVHKTKNEVFAPLSHSDRAFAKRHPKPSVAERITDNDTTNALLSSPYINAKVLDDHNLMSLNFTRKAFEKRHWDELTTKARGLFVDKNSGAVKLRSYNKFFNLGETADTMVEALSNSLAFPIKAYWKHNGFLGLMSVVDCDVVLATKSQTTGEARDLFYEIWENEVSDRDKEQLITSAINHSCTFTFEVCHVKDKHIIDFTENHLVLLDAIKNRYDMNGVDIDEAFSERVKKELHLTSITTKELMGEFSSMDELLAYVEEHKNDREIEGLVCQDRRGFMFKIKFDYYIKMKRLRGAFYYARSHVNCGIKWGSLADDVTVRFISYFINEVPFEEWETISFLDAVAMYKAKYGEVY